MQHPIFVTGIGTDVGKTVVSAILTEALKADYWKPVQAGFSQGTDSGWVQSVLSNQISAIHPETYKLKKPASPHIAAREENVSIDLNKIVQHFHGIRSERAMVIEGAGGLMVPLNDREQVADLIKALHATVVIVSRNYLGSINHSLLTAQVCKLYGLSVAGWIFNDVYLDYEKEIANWSGYPILGSIPFQVIPDKQFINEQAAKLDLSYFNEGA